MDKIKCHANNNIIKNKMKIKQLLLGMSVLAFFSSCSNDELLKNNAEGTEKIVFNLPKFEYHDNSDKTRTALDVEAMGTTWSRDKEEKIGVFPADNASGIQLPFTISSTAVSGTGSGTSVFCPYNGDWGLKNGTSYIAYSPYSSGLSATKRLYVNMRSRAIVSNMNIGSVDISGFDVMYAERTEYKSGIIFDFKRKYGLLNIQMSDIPNKTWKKIKISTVTGSSLAVSGYLDLTTGQYQSITKSSYYTVYQGEGLQGSKLNILFPLLQCTTGNLICALDATDGTSYKINLSSTDVQEGVCTLWTVSNMEEMTHTESEIQESIANDEYVDLELPSGIKWATKNIGAKSPVECGNYFAWGEVVQKDFYDESNYSFYNISLSGNKIVRKYTIFDRRYFLEQNDDVAYLHLGNGWHMPTPDDVDELISNTTQQYVENYCGSYVSGFLLTSTNNGKQIFFPRSDIEQYRSEFRHLHSGDVFEVGHYWTSGFAGTDDCAIPYFYEIISYEYAPHRYFDVKWNGCQRHYPALIRAVYDGTR